MDTTPTFRDVITSHLYGRDGKPLVSLATPQLFAVASNGEEADFVRAAARRLLRGEGRS